MSPRTRILLQTTIPRIDDDWHIGRFSMVADHLASLPGVEVTARDLARRGGTDPVLADLGGSAFDQLWLFAVDVGDGLGDAECAGIAAFRQRGGGVLTARDHQDLGCSLLGLGDVGSAHYFHTRNLDPNADNNRIDDTETPTIAWPNYHSGRNGDPQPVRVVDAGHPLFRFDGAPGGQVAWLPAHPHEGAVGVPASHPGARVLATGTSALSGRPFNLVVADDTGPGRWIAEASFHHFADYNWDPSRGAPTFVVEPVGDGMTRDASMLAHVRAYAANAARWLTPR
jgi:hypothetical protein